MSYFLSVSGFICVIFRRTIFGGGFTNASLTVAFLSKCVTDSDVFVNAPLTMTSLVVVDVDSTVMNCDQDEQEQIVTCLYCFTRKRHWQ
jgi:hypothetical protein